MAASFFMGEMGMDKRNSRVSSFRFLQKQLQSLFTETKASLDRAERRVTVQGDLLLAHASPKGQFDDGSLLYRDLSQCFADAVPLSCSLRVKRRVIVACQRPQQLLTPWLRHRAGAASPQLIDTLMAADVD